MISLLFWFGRGSVAILCSTSVDAPTGQGVKSRF